MEEIRLQKFLSEKGVLSRRAAEEEIAAGRVRVNGKPVELGHKIDPERDVVEYKGKRIAASSPRKVYLMLNKPCGYVTTMSDDRDRPCVAELVEDVGVRVYPVGRLDMESEGLLLFTNDGELANRLTHPRYHKPKEYHVKVEGEIEPETARALSEPMEIDGYMTRPAEVNVLTRKPNYSVLSVTLFEGRNRQIRKMCEALSLRVLALRRIRIGEVKLGNLAPGKWRYLTKAQVASLQKEK
ncbi:MAG: rRNA pseudouridine synthase [Ruminococcus sp.]|nr:rRNA pseudouridine synthase [Candidatus Apopatosoma intestinale]